MAALMKKLYIQFVERKPKMKAVIG